MFLIVIQQYENTARASCPCHYLPETARGGFPPESMS